MTATVDLPAAIAAERRALGDILAALPEREWNADSLCAGWRVREVVAHITMPFRYPARRFLAEMARSRGNFARMADRCARRDAQEPVPVLLEALRRNEDNPWRPPGGGLLGALTHDVVHGLDITIPLGIASPIPAEVMRAVLDSASSARSRKHFGVDLAGTRLQADDLDWALGEGQTVHGASHHLLMVLCGRRLPAGLLSGPGAPQFTPA